jgi:hypothetical protein
MKTAKKSLILLVLLLVSAGSLSAQPKINDYTPVPGEKDNLEVYLLIIGRGLPMYAWWGHIGIVIRDTEVDAEYLYDYGNFSFETEDFFTNFAMGRLWFQMMRMFASGYYDFIGSQDRDIRMHRLNIPYAKERGLKNFLDWNNRPENRLYLYHHYFDNCSTRIRDIFDELTGGQLKGASQGPSGMTLRELSRKYSGFYPLGDWIIHYLLAGNCDRPVSLWQAMFLPDYLERFVLDFRFVDEAGNTVPLIVESRQPSTATKLVPVPPGPDPVLWYRGLLVGLLWALPGILLGLFRKTGPLHDVYRLLTGFLPALPGSMLFFMMFFSNHDVTYGNWNILAASPLGFAVIPLSIWYWIDRKKNPGDGLRLPQKVLLYYFAGMAFLSVVALIGGRLPGAEQNNLMIVLTFLPAYLAGAFRWEVLSGFLSARAGRQGSLQRDPSPR